MKSYVSLVLVLCFLCLTHSQVRAEYGYRYHGDPGAIPTPSPRVSVGATPKPNGCICKPVPGMPPCGCNANGEMPCGCNKRWQAMTARGIRAVYQPPPAVPRIIERSSYERAFMPVPGDYATPYEMPPPVRRMRYDPRYGEAPAPPPPVGQKLKGAGCGCPPDCECGHLGPDCRCMTPPGASSSIIRSVVPPTRHAGGFAVRETRYPPTLTGGYPGGYMAPPPPMAGYYMPGRPAEHSGLSVRGPLGGGISIGRTRSPSAPTFIPAPVRMAAPPAGGGGCGD